MKSGKTGKNMTIWNEIAHVIGIEFDFGIALSGNGIYCVYEIYCGNGMNTAQNLNRIKLSILVKGFFWINSVFIIFILL